MGPEEEFDLHLQLGPARFRNVQSKKATPWRVAFFLVRETNDCLTLVLGLNEYTLR
jgi:hypothetical protein